MGASIQQISVFPVKGLQGTELDVSELALGAGIPRDRAFAFRYAESAAPAPREFPWAPKTGFAVQHDWPGLARLRCALDPSGTALQIDDPVTGESARSLVATESGRAALARFVTVFLARIRPSAPSRHPAPAELELVGSVEGGTRYPDRGKMHVSILNLASLRDLERAVGMPLDIRRFRGNVIVDGIPAWSEFDWERRAVEIGGARVEIKAPLLRCHNINVDPVSGDDDVPLLERLKEKFDHIKFGMAGTVVSAGEIAVGDSLRVKI